MFKKFIPKSPLGIVLTSAAMIFFISPKARSGTRKLLVRGMGAALAIGDQMKGLTSGVRHQVSELLEEAKHEKEMMNLPNIPEAMKEMTEKGMAKSKESVSQMKYSIGNLFNDIGTEETNKPLSSNTPINVMNDPSIQKKLNEIEEQLH
jgi:hypothetical protein